MNIFKIKKISDSLHVIGECCNNESAVSIYLVIGKDKAALIDTGFGLTGDLDIFTRKYTSLPVAVLSTHAHPDHIGANSLFNEIYLSKLDDDLIEWSLNRETRLGNLPIMSNGNKQLCEYAEKHAVGEDLFSYKDIQDGDIFDLGGGIVLEAIPLPGHTPGSFCFINRKDNYCLAGDAINPTPWLWLNHSTSIEVYLKSLRYFQKRASKDVKIYCGHSLKVLPESIVDDLIRACEDVIDGRTEKDDPFTLPWPMDTSGIKIMQHDSGEAQLIYDANKISES